MHISASQLSAPGSRPARESCAPRAGCPQWHHLMNPCRRSLHFRHARMLRLSLQRYSCRVFFFPFFHCYEVTFVKRKIKEYSPLASHSCRSLTASGQSHDLPVPGIWPLCYSWIGYQQANGSPRALQSKNVGHYFYCAYIVETQIARTLK